MWATLIGRRVVQGDSAALIFHHWPFVLCFLYFLCFLSFFLLDSFSVHSYVWSLSLCSVRIWTLNDWRFSLLEGFINEMNGLLLSSSFYSSCLFVFFFFFFFLFLRQIYIRDALRLLNMAPSLSGDQDPFCSFSIFFFFFFFVSFIPFRISFAFRFRSFFFCDFFLVPSLCFA